MTEREEVLPEEVRRQKEREEQIKDGVWRPKILTPYADRVVCGASTKKFPGLIYLRDEERFSHPIQKAEKVRAGRSLIEFLRALNPELDPKKVVYPELAHTTNVVLVDEELVRAHIEPRLKIEQTDGLITELQGYTLMILGADCPSVAVYDPKANAIGLFHSGWRGTAGGITL
ncbi:laccase domain-containing protein, partial [bacterium]|nr:laccase domain-containing protein [bacterium]